MYRDVEDLWNVFSNCVTVPLLLYGRSLPTSCVLPLNLALRLMQVHIVYVCPACGTFSRQHAQDLLCSLTWLGFH